VNIKYILDSSHSFAAFIHLATVVTPEYNTPHGVPGSAFPSALISIFALWLLCIQPQKLAHNQRPLGT
jgi:hypothetical protein